MVPVAVSMIPAAAAPTTPWGPRMSTAAPAPAVGPMGSWPSMTTAMRTAMASNTEASMPTACEHEPVAGDLRDDGDEDEADEPGAAVSGAQDGEAAEDRASRGAPRGGQAGGDRDRHGDADDRGPPRQPERADEA